jgi:hypothetical protein
MRSLFSTFLLCTVVGLLAFGGVYFWKKNQIDHHHEHLSAFEWFCEEFDVGVEQQRKIEALHLAYFPECEDHCIHYADTKQTLARMNEDPGLDHPEHAAAAKQLTELKKEADKKFIDFIYSVAAEMKSDSSERYLQRMKGWLEKTAKIAAE